MRTSAISNVARSNQGLHRLLFEIVLRFMRRLTLAESPGYALAQVAFDAIEWTDAACKLVVQIR